MSDSKTEGYPQPLDWFRYSCAFMLYTYGISKLLHLQFDLQSQLARQPIGSLTGYQLTWFYFGYSRAYAVLLGLTFSIAFAATTIMVAGSLIQKHVKHSRDQNLRPPSIQNLN